MKSLLNIQQLAPGFSLPDLHGQPHALSDFLGRICIINFWSAYCPWAKEADTELHSYLEEWEEQVVLLSIASNANESPAEMAAAAAERGISIVLHDADRTVAERYGAETTPHLFVVDAAGVLQYQGGLNNKTFRQRVPTQFYVKAAVDRLLAGQMPDPAETAAYGCTIVYYP
jgi:peroxiredoxin